MAAENTIPSSQASLPVPERGGEAGDFAEDVSASLTRALEEIGTLGRDERSRSRAAASGGTTLTPPSAENMEQALGSKLNATLGSASGAFLAGLLDGAGSDDPADRDYGDRYRYLDLLGEGGQGKVLRFRDTVLDRDVAIKVIKSPHTAEREKLLENEARLGGMLEHPNILPTYDLSRDETGSPFFVMKKVEGVSLDELLKKAHAAGAVRDDRAGGEYSRRRLINIFLQVCNAIQYAHSRGVCHLDLKPQNVTLGPFGEVYVLDWGFAARVEDNPKMVAGTPLYIAPERFKPGKPDARCDIYSLGVMLYRILVNQLPRDVGKTSFKEFRRRIQDFPVIPPRQRDPQLPRDLEAIVMKAIRDNPAERYRTVGELARDLERFLDILPVTAFRDGFLGRAKKFARRHRAPVAAGAVMLLALLLTAGASLRARRLERIAEEEQRRLVEKAELAQLRLNEEQKRRAEATVAARRAEDGRAEALERQREAEERRMRLVRLRAAARVPMEKGLDIMDKSKTALDGAKGRESRLSLIQPAITLFTQTIDMLDRDGDGRQDAAGAYYARARAYEQANEYDKAIEDYKAALDRDPSYIMAHYYLGLLYFNRKPEDEGKPLEEFTAMNAIDPGNEFSEVGQAYIDANRGRDAEALRRVDGIEARDRAAAATGAEEEESWRNPGLANVWLIRGMVYGKRAGAFYDPEKGIEAYSNYLLYDSEKPSPFSNRGVLHEALYLRLRENPATAKEAEEHLDAAIADYTRALAVDPNFKTALQHRGYAYFKYRKDTPAALRDIDAALAIDPKFTTVILDRAAIREEEGNFALAEKDYLLVKEINPNHVNIDYRLGIHYLYTGRLEESERHLTASILAVEDRSVQAVRYHRRGSVRLLLGRYAEAVSDFDRSLEYRRGGHIYPALMRWIAQGRLGALPPPSELAQSIGTDAARPWLTVVASVYMGDDPEGEEQAIRLATTPEAVSEVGFYLGARSWVMNEFEKADVFFQRAVDGGDRLATEYSMAKILLERLTRQIEDARQLPDTVGLPPTVPSLSDLVE